mgnify:CR=1 FL=1
MASTVASLDYALKERYTDKKVQSATLRDNVALDMCSKDEDFCGDVEPVPIIYGAPQGAGSTLAKAQSNKTNVVGKKWNITVGDYFFAIDLGDKAMTAARKDLGSFLKHKATEIEEGLQMVGNDLSLQFWGNGGAPFGQRASISGNVITLTNRYDAQNFDIGMVIVASDNDGSDAAHTLLTGSTVVTAVNYEAGTVTVDDATDISSFGNNDYLFRDGSFAGNVSQSQLWKGIQSWNPASAPTSGDNHFGMDRSSSSRLYGYRLPTALAVGTIEERLSKMATEVNTLYGTTPRKGFVHPRQWHKLSKQLAAQGVRPIEVKNKTGTWGYQSLQFTTNYGQVDVCADRHCPILQAHLLDMAHIKIKSMEKLVHAMNADGLQMLRGATTADYELRWVSYANVCVDKPSSMARGALPAVT